MRQRPLVQTLSKYLSWGVQRLAHLSAIELLFLLFIAIIVFWGYYDTLDDFFIMDDFDMIRGHSSLEDFMKHWSSPVGANSYRTLIDLLFIWDFYWWKWDPFGWHLSDLIFHILNSLLVYGLAKSVLRNRYGALIAGVLFGLHTSHTEAVTWISARMDVVCTTFFLLSVLCFMSSRRPAKSELLDRRRRQAAYGASLVFFFCGLLVKEMVVTLPGIVIAYDLIFSTRWKLWRTEIPKKIKLYLPYVFVLALYFALRFYALYNPDKSNSLVRGTIGGYDVQLLGTFIVEHLVKYWQFLAIPFTEQVFSASVLANFTGIAVLTILCLWLSKESRFAVTWIFLTLLPVLSFTIGRGVYLASVGFCLLIAMVLNFDGNSLGNGGSPRRLFIQRNLLRGGQILLTLLIFYQYGGALQESNAWWGEVAEINEKVPLMMKTLHPNFPKDARVCFQSLPLVFNQRFNAAFHFRYPAYKFAGVYADGFDSCLQDSSERSIKKSFFFHFHQHARILSDVSYQQREKARLRDAPPHEILISDPQTHLLSRNNPSLEIIPETGNTEFLALGLVTSLGNSPTVPQGTLIAHVHVEDQEGQIETFNMAAGVDTAEWAFRFPDVRPQVQHAEPEHVYMAWTVPRGEKNFVIGQNYIQHIQFQKPLIPAKITLEFLPSAALPANLGLDVNRLILYAHPPGI